MTTTASPFFEELKQIVGPQGYREGDAIDQKHYKDLMGARKICPVLHLRPANTEQVSQILSLCHQNDQPVSPQGGMTGLVSAAAPLEGEVTLSLDRMNSILEVDPYSASITVEAGTPLQIVQEKADEAGLLFPLDLGARGSCTIGGNLATNAGGNRVIRYGMMRDLVIGMEMVLADGTIINEMHKLRKNNTGYDLKQLFIGSEGTLGIITKAVLKLFPKPNSQVVSFCQLNSFEDVSKLLVHMQQHLGGNLTAFEVLWQNTYEQIRQHVPHVNLPFKQATPFSVLVESMGTAGEADQTLFNQSMEAAFENELISDAVISQSDKEVQQLWAIRDGATEIPRAIGRMHAYDVSMAIGDMQYFGEQVEQRIRDQWPEATISLFGHIGDGNLHVLAHVGEGNREAHHAVDETIYGIIKELNGAISAEHGIGLMKKEFLPYSRSSAEIALMKTIKASLDPKNILSPGRIF
ncbi:FAD-binding oxidoreductase [Aurantivibrio plasticivorans]